MPTPDTFVFIINQILPEPHASLLSGMLFGVRANMPIEFYQALRTTGTLHIIALSGMNITIIINVLGQLLMIFGRRTASVLTLLFIILFVLFVGPSANVIRAALMGGLGLFGTIFGRQRLSLLSLIFTGIAMLTVKPDWLWDIGFQLSFLSTLGIILLGGGGTFAKAAGVVEEQSGGLAWVSRMRIIGDIRKTKIYQLINTRFHLLDGLFHTFWIDFRATLAAQLFTFPVIFYNFKQISLIAPLANVLVGWIVQPITVFGLFIALVGWIFPPAGLVLAWFIFPLLNYFITVVFWTAAFPLASFSF